MVQVWILKKKVLPYLTLKQTDFHVYSQYKTAVYTKLCASEILDVLEHAIRVCMFLFFFLSVAILFSKKNISTLQPRIYVSFHIYLPQHLARFVVLVCVTVKRPGHES